MGRRLRMEQDDFNASRPRQNGRHLTDDLFKYIFFDDGIGVSFKISKLHMPWLLPGLFYILRKHAAWDEIAA